MPDLTHEQLAQAKPGTKFETTFGPSPATLVCVERVDLPGQGPKLRFALMVFGVMTVELAAAKQKDGSWKLSQA
jgi:hypothetical protein